jgi:hypothetical protein
MTAHYSSTAHCCIIVQCCTCQTITINILTVIIEFKLSPNIVQIRIAYYDLNRRMPRAFSPFWFHENKDKVSNPGNEVYRVSNCHVLHKDTTVKYEPEAANTRTMFKFVECADSSRASTTLRRPSITMACSPTFGLE